MTSKKKTHDINKLIDTDHVLSLVMRNMICARQLVRQCRETTAKHINTNIKGVDSKAVLTYMMEKVNNSTETIDKNVLVAFFNKYVLPFLRGNLRNEDENAKRLNIIRQAHERRKRLVYVGIPIDSPAGYVLRSRGYAYTGPKEVREYVADFIWYRASVFIASISGECQRVVRLADNPVIYSIGPPNELANRCLYRVNNQLIPNDLDKHLDEWTKSLGGKIDLLLIDNIWSVFADGKPHIDVVRAVCKKHGTAYMLGTDKTVGVVMPILSVETVMDGDKAFAKFGNTLMRVPLRIVERVNRDKKKHKDNRPNAVQGRVRKVSKV